MEGCLDRQLNRQLSSIAALHTVLPLRVGGEWRVPCTIRDATAIGQQSVCWPLKKHANLITANFISLWPPHGSRSPGTMRQ
jgi:hypothetical protein